MNSIKEEPRDEPEEIQCSEDPFLESIKKVVPGAIPLKGGRPKLPMTPERIALLKERKAKANKLYLQRKKEREILEQQREAAEIAYLKAFLEQKGVLKKIIPLQK